MTALPMTLERPYQDEHNQVEFVIVFSPNYTFANVITSATYYHDPKNRNPDITISYHYKYVFSSQKKLSTLPLPHSFAELIFSHYHQSARNLIAKDRDLALSIVKAPDTIQDYALAIRLAINWVAGQNALEYIDYPYAVETRDPKVAALVDKHAKLKLDYYLNHGASVIKKYLTLLEKNHALSDPKEELSHEQQV